jgi:hypothetical protein
MATLQTLTKTLTTATKLTTNTAPAEDKLNPSKTTPIMNHKAKSTRMFGNLNKIINNQTTITMPKKKTKASAGSVKLPLITREPYSQMTRKKKIHKSVGCLLSSSRITITTKIIKRRIVLRVLVGYLKGTINIQINTRRTMRHRK